MYDPYFKSRTPTPEQRMGPGRRYVTRSAAAAAAAAAAADSDTDSVKAAKKEAADINAAVSAGNQQAYLQLLSRFQTVSAEGLSAWQADVEWLSDPWADVGREKINNVVLSTLRVEGDVVRKRSEHDFRCLALWPAVRKGLAFYKLSLIMPSGKASKRKRTSAPSSAAIDPPRAVNTPTAAVTSPITEAFAVKCSRKSALIEIDEDIYIDLWGEECDDATNSVEDSATGFDGSWVWDSDPIKSGCQYYDYRKKVDDRKKSFLGGKGRPVVFKDRAASEAAAFSVWQAMLEAQDRPTKPLLQQLEEQAAKKGPQKGAAKKGAAASAGDQQAYQQLLSRFHTSAGGLSAWQADVEWWDDPESCGEDATFKNVVLTTIRVEVIKASIV